ncbi:hypothetical protein WJX72_005854 [[Myrmecia] bisecta]|uniref:F-box domain-containing protein n=1 Tax=[Myrmecia] bisecta TaxID=41462 RepID=A0AAW1R7C3_9CHLO
MEDLSPDLLCEVFKRVPLATKRNLPLVCKVFARLLKNPPVCDLWGTITLDFSKLKEGRSGEAAVLSGIQWLGQSCAGVSCIKVVAPLCSPSGVEAHLAVLAGSLLSAAHVPALELQIAGGCGDLLDMAIFQEPTFLPFLSRLRVLELCYDDHLLEAQVAVIPQLVGLETLKLTCQSALEGKVPVASQR